MSASVMVVDQLDNVATALRPLKQGESFEVVVRGGNKTVHAVQAIPFGHKVSLVDLESGEPVVKYGEVIGLATKRIARGEHVHVHNVRGPEARSDS